MPEITEWCYGDSVSAERQSLLASVASFEDLVAIATNEIRGISLRVEPGRDPGLTHCLQPVFAFELPTSGDQLYNGPFGYRAWYWQSPFAGLRANAHLIDALTPKLLAVADITVDPTIARINLCASLQASSAKFWIQELPSLLANPTAELKVEPWRTEAHRGVQLARWGVSAPEVTRFNVKGALLDAGGNEVVPSRKTRRHYDIHHYGFS